jgi:hypothetical protein
MSVGEPTPNPSQEGTAVRPPRCQMYSKHFEKWYYFNSLKIVN